MKHQVKLIFDDTNKERSRSNFEGEVAQALNDGFEIRGFHATDFPMPDDLQMNGGNILSYGYVYALLVYRDEDIEESLRQGRQ